jgi:hypothetical protein
VDVYRVDKSLFMPRVRSPSRSLVEIRSPMVPLGLLRRISCLQASDGGIFREADARLFCSLYFGSSSCVEVPSAGGGDAVISMDTSTVSGDGGTRAVSLLFCERVGFVPDGCATDSVGGGGGWLFQSSVAWQTATDLFSTPSPHKSADDDLSSITMHLMGVGRWLLRLLQSLTPLVRSGDGSWRASSLVTWHHTVQDATRDQSDSCH